MNDKTITINGVNVNIGIWLKRAATLLFVVNLFLILILALTGFEINGNYGLFGFEKALFVHDTLAVVFAFLFFGSFSLYVFDFYDWISLPKAKRPQFNKFYVIANCVIIPAQVVTGIVYYLFPFLRSIRIMPGIGFFSNAHTLLAYAIIAGVIIHLYLFIIGKSSLARLK